MLQSIKIIINKNRFKPGAFVKNVAKLGSATIINQILAFIAVPIISRIYAPEDFGQYGVFIAIAGFFIPLLGGKYEAAIVIAKNEKEANSLYLLSIFFTVLVSIIVILIPLFFINQFLLLFKMEGDKTFIFYLLPVFLFLFGFAQTNKYYLNRHQEYGVISKSIISGKLSSIISKLLYGFLLNGSAFGLILGESIDRLIFILFTFFLNINNTFKSIIENVNFKTIKRTAFKYRNFPKYEMWTDYLNTIGIRLPFLILAYYFNPIIVGFYIFSDQMLRKFIKLFSTNIGTVYYQKISQIDQTELRSKTIEVIRRLSLIGVFPFSLLLVSAPEIFEFVFGNKWITAGVYSQLLSPFIFIIYMLKSIGSLFRVLDYQKYYFRFNLVFFISFTSATIIGGVSNDAVFTVLLISLTGTIVHLLMYFWILRKINIRIMDLVLLIGKYILISMIVVLPTIFIKIYTSNLFLALLSLPFSVIFFLILIYIFDRETINKLVKL
jgi:lipopolysaccharide exporter